MRFRFHHLAIWARAPAQPRFCREVVAGTVFVRLPDGHAAMPVSLTPGLVAWGVRTTAHADLHVLVVVIVRRG